MSPSPGKPKARLTELGWVLLGWTAVVLLVSLWRDVLIWRFAASLGLAALVVSWFVGSLLSQVTIEELDAALLLQGEARPLHLRIGYAARLPLPGVHVEIHHPAVQGQFMLPLLVRSDDGIACPVVLRALRRAAVSTLGVHLSTRSPWNLIHWQQSFEIPAALEIMPRPAAVRDQWLRDGLNAAEWGASTRREEEDFFSLRDHRPGDPERRVHLKHSARRGTKMIKVLRSIQSRQVCLCIDLRLPGLWRGSSQFERGLQFAAGVVAVLLARDVRVTLARLGSDGPELLQLPSHDPRSYGRVFSALEAAPVLAPATAMLTDPAEGAGLLLHFQARPPVCAGARWRLLAFPSAEVERALLPRTTVSLRSSSS